MWFKRTKKKEGREEGREEGEGGADGYEVAATGSALVFQLQCILKCLFCGLSAIPRAVQLHEVY